MISVCIQIQKEVVRYPWSVQISKYMLSNVPYRVMDRKIYSYMNISKYLSNNEVYDFMLETCYLPHKIRILLDTPFNCLLANGTGHIFLLHTRFTPDGTVFINVTCICKTSISSLWIDVLSCDFHWQMAFGLSSHKRHDAHNFRTAYQHLKHI